LKIESPDRLPEAASPLVPFSFPIFTTEQRSHEERWPAREAGHLVDDEPMLREARRAGVPSSAIFGNPGVK
jgi:hypothetical protein